MKHRVIRTNLSIALFIIFIFTLYFVGNSPIKANAAKFTASSNQNNNFLDDLEKANDYWTHNKLGSKYFRSGDYNEAISEYKIAIKIIENIPGESWNNVSRKEMDRINWESAVSKQIFSRYGLIEALEKAGRYEEAIQNVEWLQKNQVMKGKEELLKSKLEAMKRRLLRQINPNSKDAALTYQEMDYVWDQIYLAEEAQKHQKLKEALEYYKKGFNGNSGNFEIISPERRMCATYLILLNRELDRYDEALSVVDFIDSKTANSEEKKVLKRARQGILNDKNINRTASEVERLAE